MYRTRIGRETRKNPNSIGDVRTSCETQIHKGTNCREIENDEHESLVFIKGGTHFRSESKTRVHKSGDRTACAESKAVQHINNVLML
jgi:hypothetical protein